MNEMTQAMSGAGGVGAGFQEEETSRQKFDTFKEQQAGQHSWCVMPQRMMHKIILSNVSSQEGQPDGYQLQTKGQCLRCSKGQCFST